MLGEAVVALPLGDVIDFAKERARLEKDLKKAQDEIARFDAKLSNEQFVSKAPEEVLTEQREKRAEAAALAVRLTDAIGRLAVIDPDWRRGCSAAERVPNSSTLSHAGEFHAHPVRSPETGRARACPTAS